MPDSLEEKIKNFSNLVKLVAIDQVNFELSSKFMNVINDIIHNHPKGYYYLTSKYGSVEEAKRYSGITGIDFRISTWYYDIRRTTREADPYLDFLLREVYEPFKNNEERYNIYDFSRRHLDNTSSYDVLMEDLSAIWYCFPQMYVAGRELVNMFINQMKNISSSRRQLELLDTLIEKYRDSFRLFQESAKELVRDYQNSGSEQFKILMKNVGSRYQLLKDAETRFREKLADYLMNEYLPSNYGYRIDGRRIPQPWDIF